MHTKRSAKASSATWRRSQPNFVLGEKFIMWEVKKKCWGGFKCMTSREVVRSIMPLWKLSLRNPAPSATAKRERKNFRQIAFFPLDRTTLKKNETNEWENSIVSTWRSRVWECHYFTFEKCNFNIKNYIEYKAIKNRAGTHKKLLLPSSDSTFKTPCQLFPINLIFLSHSVFFVRCIKLFNDS